MPGRLFALAIASIFSWAIGTSASANCDDNWPLRWSMPISSSDFGKNLETVLSQNGFYRQGSVRNSDNRLSFTSTPSGSPGLRMNVPKGENAIVSFDTAPLGSPGGERACISADVYFTNIPTIYPTVQAAYLTGAGVK